MIKRRAINKDLTNLIRWARATGALALILWGAFALSPAGAGTAWAQSDQQKVLAKEHFEKASRFYDVGKYAEAIEEYQQAYLNVEDPVFLFNIAQCYRLSDQPTEAVRFYRNYLRKAPNAPNRADVERRIADLDRLGDDHRKNTPNTAPAPLPTVPSGTATAPPPPPPPAATTPPALAPEPVLPAAPQVPPSPSPDGAPAPARSARRTWAYGLMAGGGASLVVAIITGSAARSKAKQLEVPNTVFDPAVEKSGKALNAVAVTTGLLGVAAGITGVVLLLTDKPAEKSANVGVGAASSWAWAPLVGSGHTGLLAYLTF